MPRSSGCWRRAPTWPQQGDLGTPLHVAALMDDVAAARLLLDHGAAIDSADRGPRMTPLHVAASYGKPEVAAFLLDRGASIEVKDLSGRTPLVLAAQMGQTTLVELLLGRGADPRAEDKDEAPPLDIGGPPRLARDGAALLEHGRPGGQHLCHGPLPLVEAARARRSGDDRAADPAWCGPERSRRRTATRRWRWQPPRATTRPSHCCGSSGQALSRKSKSDDRGPTHCARRALGRHYRRVELARPALERRHHPADGFVEQQPDQILQDLRRNSKST